MGRTLRYAGLAVLAAAAWVSLAGEVGWVAAEVSDAWLNPLLVGGGGLFLVGAVLSLLGPVGRRFTRGRCARCNSPIEKGQTYCLDHLRDTLNEYHDHVRNRAGYR